MSKFCIFCGDKPKEKSREHIIPQWLIELTGDPKRRANFGTIKFGNGIGEQRSYPFKHFTFPACVQCNNTYGKLEGAVKPIVVKILNEKEIESEELSLFFDWLDKVRVGLWLGMQQLDQNYLDVESNFHIARRIGQYDRMIIVQKTDKKEPGINFGAIDTPAFSYTPSAFSITINNFNFINISSAFLFARRIGFPYLREMVLSPDSDEYKAELLGGCERVMQPLIRRTIKQNGTILYQPQFKNGMVHGKDLFEYDTDYVKSHSLNHEKGDGNIFSEKNGKFVEYSKGEFIHNLKSLPINNDYRLSITSSIETYKWQNWIHTLLPDLKLLSREQKNYIKKNFQLANRVNKLWISKLEKML